MTVPKPRPPSICPIRFFTLVAIFFSACCTSTGCNEYNSNGEEGNETFVIIPSDASKQFSLNTSKISVQPHYYHNEKRKKGMIKQSPPKVNLDGFLAKAEGAASNFRILVHDKHDGGVDGNENNDTSNNNSHHHCSLQKTSSSAIVENCAYAVNGGPFQSYFTGGCVGLVISNGEVIHYPIVDKEFSVNGINGVNKKVDGDNNSNVGFGVTNENEWVLGDIIMSSDISTFGTDNHITAPTSTTDNRTVKSRHNEMISNNNHNNKKIKVKEFVSGLFGWLIKDNKIIPPKDADNVDDNDYAPRTAIGVNAVDGNLIVFQVDGCEKCSYKDKQRRGVTLYQMAEIMMSSPQINATYAINLDGGGSSTSVMGGKVLNRPTCIDYFNWKCERPVGSVVCIKGDSHDDFQSPPTQSTKR